MNAMNVKSGRSALTQRDDTSTQIKKLDPFQTNRDSASYLRGKLVGGHIPLPLANYLNVLALYYEKSIQGTLQSIIQEWCYEKEPIETIAEVLADRAYLEWKRRLTEYKIDADTAPRREAYLQEIRDRLRKHKVTDEIHVEAVVKRLGSKMEIQL
jgi:hypothetical protein